MIKFKTGSRLLLMACILLINFMHAQQPANDVYVDENGIMRWGKDDTEVHGFGVNYSAPFAHGYRSAKKLGLDIKAEIDKDIYHFTRLNFDLYRLHVWDTEISDAKGNLLENEKLETFDYLLSELKKRDINYVITPIAYWGNGWPEPDEDTPGFSHKFGKEKSLTHPDAIKAQQNYLKQFLEHVNPYTGLAYKEDPNIIAFEISNEPHHRGSPEEVMQFINKMVAAIKGTGTKKPVFYNVSHSVHLAETYFNSNIDGGTFQWYPTGLGFQKELEGNLLPNVNDYRIPFDEVIKSSNKAKLVYEFDAADVNKSYMYPAMARSFREAGIQVATHFAYDPSFLAYANTEYNTHYMNLNYTPHKALALMIASEIFHEIPMREDLGGYPQNLEFGDFKISYQDDLATYNSETKFIYTNSNSLEAKNIAKLKQVAGHGSSKLVKYNGKGAYFLDKLDQGVWRLEVMPDPILLKDPFGSNSLDQTLAVISWKKNKMEVHLEELGEDFSISGLNQGNDRMVKAEGYSFQIGPGTYLLSREGLNFNISDSKNDSRIPLKAFEAVESTVDDTYLVHEPLETATENIPWQIEASVVSNDSISKVEAWFQNGNIYRSLELDRRNNYDYSVEIPGDLLQNGFLTYRIIVFGENSSRTFPGGLVGNPGDWDFSSDEKYQTRILAQGSPLYIFNATTDSEKMVRTWNPGNKVIPVNDTDAEFRVRLDKLFKEDVENLNAEPVYDYSFRHNFSRKISKRGLKGKSRLVVEARALNDQPEKLMVALIMKNGAAFGKVIEVDTEIKEIDIKMEDLKPVKTVTLPRPYPGFLPYYFEHSYSGDLDLEEVENLQFSIGPGMSENELQQPHAVGIRKVSLQ